MKLLSTASAAALALVVMATASQAASVSAAASAASVDVGDEFTIELKTSGDTEDLFGFQTTLTFDESALSLTDIEFNTGFPVTSPLAGPFTSDLFVTAGVGISPLLDGMVTLATFSFTALSEGDAVVTFGDAGLGGFLVNGQGVSIFDGTASASVSIAGDTPPVGVVPLPASALLMLTGLAGLLGLRRRMRA